MQKELENQNVLLEIKKIISEEDYNRWFPNVSVNSVTDSTLTLSTPSGFFRDKLNSDFKSYIKTAVNNVYGKDMDIIFSVSSESVQMPSVEKKSEQTEKTVITPKAEEKNDYIFNPSYTFSNFVPGENSQIVYNAALAIANNPGSTYNPLLIYGGVGLGKTHLLQSIGNHLIKTTKLKVMYVTAENYTNELIQALFDPKSRTAKTKQFQNKYRKTDVLLMDDIQFLEGKEQTQNELFNTFNDLYDTNRQLVFSSDRPVDKLTEIADRLRSRFSRGLVLDIQPPNYETRIAILQAKCKQKNFKVPGEVIEYIAKNVITNVRALESCLLKLMAYNNLIHKEITLESAKEQLKQLIVINTDPTELEMSTIIRAVADYYKLSPYDIKGKSKNKNIALPRQIAMYLCRQMTDYSTTEIAAEFGGKDHTTVMYNVRKILTLLESSEKDNLNNVIEKIKSQIQISLNRSL